MIIKLILVVGIIFIMGWFLSNRTSHQVRAWQRISLILFMALGIFVVIFPDSSNTLAHKVGVGRGADLLLYLLTVAFLLSILNAYLKSKEEERRVVKLARKVALIEAELKQSKNSTRQN
jgi:small membrane protein